MSADEIADNLLGEVIPGLYIGPLHSITAIKGIVGISNWTIVSLLKADRLRDFLQKSVNVLREDGCTTRHIEWELKDQSKSELISSRLDEILVCLDETLQSRKSACLVHCAFGISRSAAVIAAYLIWTRKLTTLREAMACIRLVRPEASPNLGFLAALRALEQSEGNVQEAQRRMMVRSSSRMNILV